MHKNLNDIIPPSRRRAMMGDEAGAQNVPLHHQDPASPLPPPPSMPPRPPREPRMRMPSGGGRRFPVGTALIALAVVAASVGALFFFSGAEATISPTKNPVQVTSTFAANLGEGDIPFEVVSVEKSAASSVEAESTENVTQAAQGTIVVSNAQDAAQPLIRNTRFETPEGLIFRIRDSITVPAAKNGQPGTLTVTVYAEEAGERYNIGATTFTLPGLAGSDTFDKVTARSSAPMQGGFDGPRPTVSEATKDAEYAKLQQTLTGELATELAAKVPVGYVLIPGATASTFEEQPDTAGAGNTVQLGVRGVMRGVIFPEEAIAKAIAYQSVGTYSGQPLKFESVEGLQLAPAEGLIPTDGDTEFSFTLTGSATLVWKVDAAKIAAAIAGKNREAANTALEAFPEVERAVLVLKPFWKSAFPADPAKISIKVEGQEEPK